MNESGEGHRASEYTRHFDRPEGGDADRATPGPRDAADSRHPRDEDAGPTGDRDATEDSRSRVLAEYRAAYAALRRRDPAAATAYPDPDAPPDGYDPAAALEMIRRGSSGLRGVPGPEHFRG